MKRDMDLIRKVLLYTEDSKEATTSQAIQKFTNYHESVIKYHLQLLLEAGLMKGQVSHVQSGLSIYNIKLTWEGHEFLDAARDEKRWEQAKDIVKEKGGSLTFDVFKALLIQLARQAVGLG